MRAALLVVLVGLAGCPGGNDECKVDSDCSGNDVCARNGECLSASDVRTVHVTWTVRGMPASPTTCSRSPNLYLLFSSFDARDTYGYEPVPCASGLFTIDKLPKRYVSAELGVRGGFADSAGFDAQGNAQFDLMP